MASTYTLNNGIELIGTGEQSGTWGDTTNTNFELVDTALDGQVSILLAGAGSSGSPNNLPVSDGAASNGRNRMITFTDGTDLGATAYVQLTPNDSEKIIYVRNSLSGSRSIIMFQGTYNASNDYEIPAGTTAVIYFDGAGAGAVAANVFNNAYFDSLRLGGVSVTAILDEDNMASDSATALSTQQSIKAYVDAQVGTVDTLAEILANGNTTGGTDLAVSTGDDITFADDSKAIFGAGSDLQIFHLSANNASYIQEQNATANLYIDGQDIYIRSYPEGDNMIIAERDGAVTLHYDNAAKLATTATGVDITGTLTSDGLTVDNGVARLTTSYLAFSGQVSTPTEGAAIYRPVADTVAIATNTKQRFLADSNGDISFYEDTGTTPKFFWDASAEGLGIGSGGGSLEGLLDLEKTDNTVYTSASRGNGFLQISNQSTTAGTFSGIELIANGVGSAGAAEILCIDSGSGSGDLAFTTRASGTWSEKMRITSSGNVGIGTVSPSAKLDVAETNSVTYSSSAVQGDLVVSRKNSANTVNQVVGLEFDITGWSGSTTGVAGISAIQTGSNASSAALAFQTRNSGTIAEAMRIDSSGNVGIGTSSPLTMMEIADASSPHLMVRNTAGGSVDFTLARLGDDDAYTDWRFNSGSGKLTIFSDDTVSPDADRLSILYNGEMVINEGGDPLSDFRVESASNSYALFMDAGNNVIGTGTSTPATYVSGGGLAIKGVTNSDLALVSSSVASGVNSHQMRFFNEAGSSYEIARMRVNVGAGQVNRGEFQFAVGNGATLRPWLDVDYGGNVVFNAQSNDSDFRVSSDSNTHMLFVDASENRIGVNTSSPTDILHIANSSAVVIKLENTDASLSSDQVIGAIQWRANDPSGIGVADIAQVAVRSDSSVGGSYFMQFNVSSSSVANYEALRITRTGDVTTTGGDFDRDVAGFTARRSDSVSISRTNGTALEINRSNDGDIVNFRSAGAIEGTISISGSTTSYNGFAGRHESSGIPLDTEIGTVVSTIDELDIYPEASRKAGQTRADHAKIKVSDSVGDTRVYGVVSQIDDQDKTFVTSVGIGSVKVTGACQGGDLLESNGDGTAKVQSDDIIRSKTLGKVTIGNSDTGVKLVSCVMYCG